MARYDLNEQMEFDHVIEITEEGTVADPYETVYAPEVAVECAEDDAGSITAEAEATMIAYVKRQGWELMTGYSGQDRYRGPVMHASEFVGGRMETDIRETPGLYVVVEVTGLYATEEQKERNDGDPIGWVVARKVAE